MIVAFVKPADESGVKVNVVTTVFFGINDRVVRKRYALKAGAVATYFCKKAKSVDSSFVLKLIAPLLR